MFDKKDLERAVERAMQAHQEARDTGRRVWWMRDDAGRSRREVADYVGFSERTLSRVEHGQRPLLGHERAAVARALGCSIAALAVTATPKRRWQT